MPTPDETVAITLWSADRCPSAPALAGWTATPVDEWGRLSVGEARTFFPSLFDGVGGA
jgi:hypothetical protein